MVSKQTPNQAVRLLRQFQVTIELEEIRKPGRDGMVVERTRSLAEIKIRGRAEDSGVTGEHRLGETAARTERSF